MSNITDFEKLLVEQCNNFDLVLSEKQIKQFYQYYEILVEWNTFMNLTTIINMEDVIRKHFIDSISLIRYYPNIREESINIIDVGTGAGFPGIPLKIAFPQIKITLLDSLNKRVKFLNEISTQLNLEGVSSIHGRAEDYGQNKTYRETYDLCVSRAVANLSLLSEYCLPFVKVGGYFISYKSGNIEAELLASKKAFHLLGGKLEKTELFTLESLEAQRSFVFIKKHEKLSKNYPRKAGIPAKSPL